RVARPGRREGIRRARVGMAAGGLLALRHVAHVLDIGLPRAPGVGELARERLRGGGVHAAVAEQLAVRAGLLGARREVGVVGAVGDGVGVGALAAEQRDAVGERPVGD